MIRGTTPTFRLTVKGNVDLTQAESVIFSIKQPSAYVELTGESLQITEKVVKCWLTQEASLQLAEGPAKIQLNWVYLDAVTGARKRDATIAKSITIDEQLLKRAI